MVPLEVECRASVGEFYREAVRKAVRVRCRYDYDQKYCGNNEDYEDVEEEK